MSLVSIQTSVYTPCISCYYPVTPDSHSAFKLHVLEAMNHIFKVITSVIDEILHETGSGR